MKLTIDTSIEEKIKQIRKGKLAAQAARDFNTAARLRDEERRLLQMVGKSTPDDSVVSKIDKVSDKILKSIPMLFVLCLFPLYLLYQLVVHKVMWGRGGGYMHVSSGDILFWVYAAGLAAPVLFILVLAVFVLIKSHSNDNR